MAEAAAQLEPLRDQALPPAMSAQRLLEYLIKAAPEEQRSRLARHDAMDLAARWFPMSPPLLWQRAAVYFQQGQFAEAARLLEQLIHFGQTGAYDRSQAFDPVILGDGAWANLGACYTRLQ